MATNYVQPGDVLTLVAPSGGVVSGVGYKIGDHIFAVALQTAAQTESFEGKVRGVFEMPKATHDTTKAFAAGEAVFWDGSSNKRWDKTGTGFISGAAIVVEAAASTAATCKVMLTGHALGTED